ncbi:MAG: tetratricopeptide repeat protein [Thermoplasmata archaeon]
MGSIGSIADSIKLGDSIFFLGSAFSTELGYPDPVKIAILLKSRFFTEKELLENNNISNSNNIRIILKALEKHGVSKREIFKFIKEIYKPDPLKLTLNPYEILYQILKYYPEDKNIFIFTTNLDLDINLVFGNEATYIVYKSDFEALTTILDEGDVLKKRRIWIVKINGDISNAGALDILTESETFSEIRNQFFNIFKKYMVKKKALILGYNNINDVYICDLYNKIREREHESQDTIVLNRYFDFILKRFNKIKYLTTIYITSVLKDILYNIAPVYLKTSFINLELDNLISNIVLKNENILIYGYMYSGKSTTIKRLSKMFEKYDVFEISRENTEQDLKLLKKEFNKYHQTAIFVDFYIYKNILKSSISFDQEMIDYEIYEIFQNFTNIVPHNVTVKDAENLIQFFMTLENIPDILNSQELNNAVLNTAHVNYDGSDTYSPAIIYELIKLLKKDEKLVFLQYYSKMIKGGNFSSNLPSEIDSYSSKTAYKLSLDLQKRILYKDSMTKLLKEGFEFKNIIKNIFQESINSAMPAITSLSIDRIGIFVLLDLLNKNEKSHCRFLDFLYLAWNNLSISQKKLICYEVDPQNDLIYNFLDLIFANDAELNHFKELIEEIIRENPLSLIKFNNLIKYDNAIQQKLKTVEDGILDCNVKIQAIDKYIEPLTSEILEYGEDLKNKVKDIDITILKDENIKNNPIYEFGLGWLEKRNPIISESIEKKLDYAIKKIKNKENIFIIGEKGVGKTTFMYLLYKKLQEANNKIYVVHSLLNPDYEGIYFIDNVDQVMEDISALNTFLNSTFVVSCRKNNWLEKEFRPLRGDLIELSPQDFDFKTLRNILISILDSEKFLYSEEGLEEAVRRSGGLPIYFDSLILFLKNRNSLLSLDLAKIVPAEFYSIIANTIRDLEKNEFMIWILFIIANTKKNRLHYLHIKELKKLLSEQNVKGEFIEDYVSFSGDIYFLRHDVWKDLLLTKWQDLDINIEEPSILKELRKKDLDSLLRQAIKNCIEKSTNMNATVAMEILVITLENYKDFGEEILKIALSHKKEDWRTLVIDTLANADPKVLERYLGSITVDERKKMAENLKNAPNAHQVIYNNLVEYYKSISKKDQNIRAKLADSLKNLGNSFSEKNELDQAIQKYTESLDIYRNLVTIYPSFENELAMVLNDLGIVLDLKGDLTNSIKAFDEALAIKEKLSKTDIKNKVDLAIILNNLGLAYYSKNAFQISIKIYDLALDIYRSIENEYNNYEEDIAMLLDNLGLAQRDYGLIEESVQTFNKALEIYKKLDREDSRYESDVAEVLKNMGVSLERKKEPESAIRNLEKALHIYEKLVRIDSRYEQDLAETLAYLGETYASIDEQDEAIRFFNSGLNIYRALEKKDARFEQYSCKIIQNLGKQYYLKGNTDLAIKLLRESLYVFRKMSILDNKFEQNIAENLTDLGTAYFNKKSYEESSISYNEAISIYRKLKREDEKFNVYLANSLMLQGKVLEKLKSLDYAISRYKEAITIYRELSEKDKRYLVDLGLSLNKQARIFYIKNELDSAKVIYEESLLIFKKVTEESKIYAQHLADTFSALGIIYLEIDKIDDSIAHLNNAIDIYKKLIDTNPDAYSNYSITVKSLESAIMKRGF